MTHQTESPMPFGGEGNDPGVAIHDLLAVCAPLLNWYQSDEEDARPPLDILRDIVADLQSDRADALAGAADKRRLEWMAKTQPSIGYNVECCALGVGSEASAPVPCLALDLALALVDFGACRDGDPADWINVASPMCAHCIGAEDVNLAAARIIAAEYRNVIKILKDPMAVHINMLRGTIAWTPEHLRHVIGDSPPNAKLSHEESGKEQL